MGTSPGVGRHPPLDSARGITGWRGGFRSSWPLLQRPPPLGGVFAGSVREVAEGLGVLALLDIAAEGRDPGGLKLPLGPGNLPVNGGGVSCPSAAILGGLVVLLLQMGSRAMPSSLLLHDKLPHGLFGYLQVRLGLLLVVLDGLLPGGGLLPGAQLLQQLPVPGEVTLLQLLKLLIGLSRGVLGLKDCKLLTGLIRPEGAIDGAVKGVLQHGGSLVAQHVAQIL